MRKNVFRFHRIIVLASADPISSKAEHGGAVNTGSNAGS